MALHETVRNLAKVPTFHDLELEALRLIAFSAEMRILRAGDVLFQRGEASDCGYALLSGAIGVDTGTAPATFVRAAVLIGDVALIAETVRPATVWAREPSSVLKIPRSLFRRVMAEYPDSAARLRQTLAERLIDLRHELDRVTLSLTD